MRLLYFKDDGTLTFTDFQRQKPPPYAILSHTWSEEEVTFQDLSYGISSSLAGFKKIAFCGEQAAKDGLKYFWVDTCCIDKNNLPELTRSINSMFRWYRNASKCYVYVSDVPLLQFSNGIEGDSFCMDAFWNSRWFKRGWTLQELIAPKSVEFFSEAGQLLGDKVSLEKAITEITGIPPDALQGRPLSEFTVEERFAWANGRETTEEEDIAYCLLGIFDIFMPLIPGEGEVNAMKRLEKLVEESVNDNALGGPDHTTGESRQGPSSSKPAPAYNSKPENLEAVERMKAYVLNTLGSSQALSRPYKPYRRQDAEVNLNHWHRAHAISQDFAQGANAGSIFQDAHASFLNNVFWDEWPAFETLGDAEEMMTDIVTHCKSGRNSYRLLVACKYIDGFCLKWRHFFDVVELAMTIDPAWPQTMWSAIRLVFVRCKSHTNMFEKLAQMFDKLKDQLPSYHDHVLRLRKDCPDAAKSDLCKVLAIVYTDILQFCHDACAVFQMSPSLATIETDPLKNLTFIPLTVAFDDMLERIAEHKRLFDISLRNRKHVDLQAFIWRVTKALLERDEYMQNSAIRRDLLKDKEIHIRFFQENVRKWIQSPDYTADFVKAKDARSSSTGDWLQAEACYVAWRTELHRSVWKSDRHGKTTAKKCRPILWLEGAPGYGKTVLSTVIIEDLEKSATRLSESHDGRARNGVAYFFFNAQLPGKQRCLDALRGIALQVFETLQKDPEMIEILSLSMRQAEKDRTTATHEDLIELLQLAVPRLSSLTLVLDGIDECEDFAEMWDFLSLICHDTRFQCLCLARPSIQIPPEQLEDVQRLSLQGKNRLDIQKYLEKETQTLQQAGYFGDNILPGFVARSLTARANSRFLWANLIISYLRSPTLSPVQRLTIVEDSGQLDSLHGIFTGVLRQYQALYFKDRNLLTKILQFLVLAKEPLSVDQLNIAVSTKPGRKLERADLLSDFSETLKKLCGSLIEITGSVVLFSHLSFRAFLESKDAIDLKSSFRVDKKTGSLQFASVCLSYLIYHGPRAPLSGSHETTASQTDIERELPFYKYAARHWVYHAVSALQLLPGSPRELMLDCYHLLQQLGSFITCKSSISAWIEVCWTFQFPASIKELWLEFERRLAEIKITAQRGTAEWHVFESLSKIRTLSEDLERLNEHWSHLLLAKPYEIWGPSISVFLGPVSWAHNEEADITMVANDGVEENLEETILKVSRLSSCGKFIGIVRISRADVPREGEVDEPCVCRHKRCTCKRDASRVDLKDALATYQILKLAIGFPVVYQFSIPLDPDDLREVESTAESKKFRFPIAFAPNLQNISILHTVYSIGDGGALQQQRLSKSFAKETPDDDNSLQEHSTSEPLMEKPKIHFVSTHGEKISKRKLSKVVSWMKPISTKPSQVQPSHANYPTKETSRPKSETSPIYYKLVFSPCGQFIARLERQQDMNRSALGQWDITIWKRHRTDDSTVPAEEQVWKDNFELIDIYSDLTRGGTFTFNPQFQQVGLFEHTTDSPNEISVWNFGTTTKPWRSYRTTRMVYAEGLLNIHISSCGRYLFGDHPVFKNPRIIQLERFLKDAVPVPPPVSASEPPFDARSLDVEIDMSLDFDSVDASEEDYMQVTKSTSTRPMVSQNLRQPILPLNGLSLASRFGIPELSIVRRHGDGGVVLKRLSSVAGGSENLLYLPKDFSSITSVTVLDDRQDDGDTVRMVLTNDSEDSYTWDDPRNRQSASIVTRSAHSIKTIENGAAEIARIPNSTAQKLLAIKEDSAWDSLADMDVWFSSGL
ncbi:hypothetical protein BKA64DRAFT_747820 [Cadophora sp. MPI-SDFR-AT-0126]|nr:hypothetical protein BKA64DRAFT_749539 [Leotiomycetes sp. MPI-SDFR-AT-0126]KAH7389246.1 hypothetical protein BKA64DRAFT_747820 [Leotiomycetes sp. MPI-SDFR-AT-0126]